MTPTLEQLSALVATADTGSFSAAARRLGKAQSLISTHVANLELDLGLTLFDRSARLPVLTPGGTRMVAEARSVLAQRERFLGVARHLEAHIEPRLSLAIDEFYPEHLIGGLMQDFARQFPSVEIEMHFPLLEDVGRMLNSGQADLGVICRPQPLFPALETRPIGRVPLRLVCGQTHPLAEEKSVTPDCLKQHRQLIVATRGQPGSRLAERIGADVWWVESHFVMLELVKHGVGWTLMSDHVIAASPARPSLVTLTAPALERWVALELGWHAGRGLGVAGSWLRDRFLTQPLAPPVALERG
ncbi:LysR family transcriptional regulator [Larsenimonas rhizosphaerae]|uniref:LysR family transcriptional regulator n=1 Tax=Larsenimonas rhizosphaerae TaxID=2944682 RepID=UPI00203382E5|nr:LysR family transcriptional regulator [Larsenimonas rhizosphaerae]MCM2129859.1 LysR family transcriptional regulator [Larsenimonas rhizosphaerae]